MSDKQITWEDAVTWLKDQPSQAELVRACFYDDPLTVAAQRFYEGTEWRAIEQYLPATPGRVLDLGAGRGIASYAFAKSGWEVTALEPDPSAIVGANAIRGLAKDSALTITVEESWGEKLPFQSEMFDVVHARQVLHHARDLHQLCREVGRVLKKGGMLIATREHVISKSIDIDDFLESHPLHKLYGGENAYMLREYIAAITAGGLKITKVLNPSESDINLYPDTVLENRKRIAKKIGLPVSFVPSALLKLRGKINQTPGRLYTFIGHKF